MRLEFLTVVIMKNTGVRDVSICGQTNLQTLQSEAEHARAAHSSAVRQTSASLHGVTYRIE